jgi:hypothetical protein
MRGSAWTRAGVMAGYQRFRVTEIEQGDEVFLLGSATATVHCGETWIGDGWPGFLLRGGEVVPGGWRVRGEMWSFVLESQGALDRFRREPEWDVLDGYWGERAEILLDGSRQWRKARFESSDAVEFPRKNARWRSRAIPDKNAEGELIKAGWDHEHCAIRGEKIGAGGHPEGYFSAPNTWVCKECFDKFVRPRSLGFIPHT